MWLRGLHLLNESGLMEVPNKYPIENPLDNFINLYFFFIRSWRVIKKKHKISLLRLRMLTNQNFIKVFSWKHT